MTLTLDPDRQVKAYTCDCCGGERQVVTGFVYGDGQPHAVYYANCYPHQGEVWIDVILGTWDEATAVDHVTFGCRVGLVEGQPDSACSLVPAASTYGPSAIFGEKLDRPRALVHPWLDAFWAIVDLVLTTDQTVRVHVYGSSRK